MEKRRYKFRSKLIVLMSFAFLIISVLIQTQPLFVDNDFDLSYNYINIKDIAATSIAVKSSNNTVIDKSL